MKIYVLFRNGNILDPFPNFSLPVSNPVWIIQYDS